MHRVAVAGLLWTLALVAPTAGESAPPSPWDGTNPFACVVQQAGFEAEVPDPAADPYCVEFDKRRQNVTDLGVVDFLSKEPARVAAAGDKCFYFQSDHWRGSIVQDDGTTKTYEWDGHYFFDKARGEGGVWVTNFNVNGRTFDPAQLPGMPADYAQYFGPGTGGVITHDEVEADPSCVAKAAEKSPYATGPAPVEPEAPHCLTPGDPVTASMLGPARLGMREREVYEALGAPRSVRRGFLRYCFDGGGALLVGIPGDRTGSGTPGPRPAVFLLATSPSLTIHGIGPGAGAKAARKAFPRARKLFPHALRLRRGVLAVLRDKRVRALVVYDAERIRRPRAWLRRTH
jgi:hypothetical protein